MERKASDQLSHTPVRLGGPSPKHPPTELDGNFSLGSAAEGAARSSVYFGVSPCGGGQEVGNRRGAGAGAQVGPLGRLLAVNIRVILLWGSLGGAFWSLVAVFG